MTKVAEKARVEPVTGVSRVVDARFGVFWNPCIDADQTEVEVELDRCGDVEFTRVEDECVVSFVPSEAAVFHRSYRMVGLL